jgi:hypothetical protein
VAEREEVRSEAMTRVDEGARQPAAEGAPGSAKVQERGCIGAAAALAGVVLGSIYVINPGAGVFELIPDVVPIFGNLDEAAATTVLVLGLQYLFRKDRAG